MATWKLLDLRIKGHRPDNGQLVVIKLEPNGGRGDSPRFLTGRFWSDGRKLWFKTYPGCEDPARWRKHYANVWWYPLPDTDSA